MPKRLVSPIGVGCASAKVGLRLAGYFVTANPAPKGADSRVLVFDQTGKGELIGTWETGALASLASQFVVGEFYCVTCTGKKQYAKGEGWAFDVDAYSNAEIPEFLKTYRLVEPDPKPEGGKK